MVSHPSRRGSNFCRFLASDVEKNNDILGIYFVRNICVFSDAPELVQNKIPKKSCFFLGIFPDVFFIMFPFPGYVFTLCFLGGPRRPVVTFFRTPKKWHFFDVRKNDVFLRETVRCFLAPALSFESRIPHLSVNRLEPRTAEISTSKLANSKQQMSKSIQQFLKCTLISSPLVRWKWPTQVGTLGRLWWGWELGMMQSTTSAGVSEKITFFRTEKKNVFSGIWKMLAGYLAG